MARYRADCDVGGTFTDFVLVEEESGAIFTAADLRDGYVTPEGIRRDYGRDA